MAEKLEHETQTQPPQNFEECMGRLTNFSLDKVNAIVNLCNSNAWRI